MLTYARKSHQKGMTVMMGAAEEGHLGVVVKLAELGVDLGAVDDVSTADSFFSLSVKSMGLINVMLFYALAFSSGE